MKLNPKDFKNLTSNEASYKQHRFGYNIISNEIYNTLSIIKNEIKSPIFIAYSLFILITILLSGFNEAILILVILLFSSITNVHRQISVSKSLKLSENHLINKVKVIRDDEITEIESKDLVPQDIIILESNDIVPADCVLLKSYKLTIDESIISGDPFPIAKVNFHKEIKQENTIYLGTTIKSGYCIGRVINIGNKTKYGNIYKYNKRNDKYKLSNTDKFLKELLKKYILLSSIGLLFVVFFVLIFNPNKINNEFIVLLITLSIALIPETLPAINTIALSNSAKRLSKLGLYIKSPNKFEDMSQVNMIISDKTGTLTYNSMEIQSIDTNLKKDEFFKYLYLSSINSDDLFDKSIIEYLSNSKYLFKDNIPNYKDEIFDPFIKVSKRIFNNYKIIKGSAELILPKLKDENTIELALKIKNHTKIGERAIIITKENNKGEIKYIGSLFFENKIKEDVKETIRNIFNYGIDIKIISGDNINNCEYVAKNISLIESEEEIIEANKLRFDSESILNEQLLKYKVIARADPIQKYKIVEALKKKFKIAYLGDGINDIPSLTISDIGIVVQGASFQVKEKADIILKTKHLYPIVSGIIESRKIFENTNHFILHSLTNHVNTFLTISVLLIILDFSPILPIQLLIGNLIIDLVGIKYVYDSVKKDKIIKPIKFNIKGIVLTTLLLGLFNSLLDYTFFYIFRTLKPFELQTIWFSTAFILDILIMISIKSKGIFTKNLPDKNFIFSVIISILILWLIGIYGIPIISIYPLNSNLIPILVITPLIYFILFELAKIIIRKKVNI